MGEGQSRNYCWCTSGKKIKKEEGEPTMHTSSDWFYFTHTLSSCLHHFLVVKKRLERNSTIQKLLGYTNLQCKLCFQQINSQLPVHLWILHLKEEDKNNHICYRFNNRMDKRTRRFSGENNRSQHVLFEHLKALLEAQPGLRRGAWIEHISIVLVASS